MIEKLAFGPGRIIIEQIQLECGLLHDNTPIFFYDSCQRALGHEGKPATWLNDFMLHISRFVPVSIDIMEDIQEPGTVVIGTLEHRIIESAIFLQACNTIAASNAGGFLYASELHYARRAKMILEYFEGHGLQETVAQASGLDAFKTAVKSALVGKLEQSGEKAGKWAMAFPAAFFDQILKLKGWRWSALKDQLNELTIICSDVVFSRIEPAVLYKLSESKPKMRYRKANRPEEYLLHESLLPLFEKLRMFFEAADSDWETFMQLVERDLPRLTAHVAISTEAPSPDAKLSFFSENLTKAAKTGKFR